jgi:hypothetical protein
VQWLQNPSKTYGDNVNNIRRETNRSLRTKGDYLKEKIDVHTGICEFKVYQHRIKLVKR